MFERVVVHCCRCNRRTDHQFLETHIQCSVCGDLTRIVKTTVIPREEVIQIRREQEVLDRSG